MTARFTRASIFSFSRGVAEVAGKLDGEAVGETAGKADANKGDTPKPAANKVECFKKLLRVAIRILFKVKHAIIDGESRCCGKPLPPRDPAN